MTKAQQAAQVKSGKGFIAALDQSGGSTPKALKLYGVPEDAWSTEDEMYDLIHAMRSRIITSPAFTGGHSLYGRPIAPHSCQPKPLCAVAFSNQGNALRTLS